MKREEILEKMAPVMETQVRQVEHRPQTRITVTPDMITFRPGGGQRHLEVTGDGMQSLANFVGLPWHIAKNVRPETLGTLSTELLQKKERYALVVKEGAVTALVKPQEYRTLNPERVLKAIEDGVRGIDYHRILILPNFAVSLEVVGDRRQPVARGDLIQAGANITFSPLGTVEPVIQSYALRLVCTNGLTSNTILREFHYEGGDNGNIWQWFRRSAKDAYEAIDQIVTRYRAMIAENIAEGDRAMMLEALLKQAKITGEDANAIRSLAIENPPRNSYDMMNLITQATSHTIADPVRVRRAQLTVASYTSENEHARVCPVCHSRRN